MKQVGRCEQCSASGILETIDVVEIGTDDPEVQLLLCARCAVVPSAVWRRRYQPTGGATTAVRHQASPSPNSRR